MPKSSGTVRGSKIVPKVSPSAEQVTHASGVSVTSTSQCTWRLMWIWLACTTAAIGNTIAAASSPWIAPKMTFSSATSDTGSGASTRSSISLV